jgi:hypothetical protein
VLTAIKLLHTVIWALLAASILVLPVVGVLRRFSLTRSRFLLDDCDAWTLNASLTTSSS